MAKRLAAWLCLLSLAGCHRAENIDVSLAPARLDDGWTVAAPSGVDADDGPLESMVRALHDGSYRNIDGILVSKDGKLVVEQYFNGHDRTTFHEIRSATKSIGSMIVGLAVDRGLIDSVDVEIHPYFAAEPAPEEGWDPRFREITLRHLLTMTSGFDCDDITTDFGCENPMHRSGDWVAYVLSLGIAHSPGEHFAYNSPCLTLVGEIVSASAGEPVHEFARRHLFDPLGIDEFRWHHTPRGRGWVAGSAEMLPRDMARLGVLMLDEGEWQGRRILSEKWVRESTGRHVDMHNGVWYGYLWQTGRTYVGTELIEAFWASGNGGQYIIVLPDHGLVAVFTGGNFDSPLANQPFELLHEFILPAFLRPARLSMVNPTAEELQLLSGEYALDFEPAALSTVRVRDRGLELTSPEAEVIPLVAHTPKLFSGTSQYGTITATFEVIDESVRSVTIRSAYFAEFTFLRREPTVEPTGRSSQP
jgi:CubicO group peptidase (beta-lactamase class C family)